MPRGVKLSFLIFLILSPLDGIPSDKSWKLRQANRDKGQLSAQFDGMRGTGNEEKLGAQSRGPPVPRNGMGACHSLRRSSVKIGFASMVPARP